MPTDNAVIIGGGPAGASAAIGLRRLGRPITLFEQRSDWPGRVCGAFLSPEGVRQLHWLGVWDNLKRKNPVPVPSALLTTPMAETEIDISQKGIPGLALPRRDLEETLLEAAMSLGARVHRGARVVKAEENEGTWTVTVRQRTSLHDETASLLVFADGRFSMGRGENRSQHGWYGFNAAFRHVRQKPGELALHFFMGGYIGVISFGNKETNVCGLIHKAADKPVSLENTFQAALRKQPFLRKMLEEAERITPWRGVGPLPYSRSLPRRRHALFVGDAASVGDPFMGEGISRSLSSGMMIFKSFGLKSNTFSLGQENPIGAYEHTWERYYSSRFRWGKWIRTGLTAGLPSHFFFSGLLRQRWLIRFLTPYFHGHA